MAMDWLTVGKRSYREKAVDHLTLGQAGELTANQQMTASLLQSVE